MIPERIACFAINLACKRPVLGARQDGKDEEGNEADNHKGARNIASRRPEVDLLLAICKVPEIFQAQMGLPRRRTMLRRINRLTAAMTGLEGGGGAER